MSHVGKPALSAGCFVRLLAGQKDPMGPSLCCRQRPRIGEVGGAGGQVLPTSLPHQSPQSPRQLSGQKEVAAVMGLYKP